MLASDQTIEEGFRKHGIRLIPKKPAGLVARGCTPHAGAVLWVPRQDLVKRGYPKESARLWAASPGRSEPTPEEWAEIGQRCEDLQRRMLAWNRTSELNTEPAGAPPANQRQGEATQAPAPLALVTPPQWRGTPIPPRRWLAANRITADDAIILSGDGGAGKTTIALQLAVAVERGLGDWLGTTCETGPVIFFSAEEPEAEMRRRLQSAAHGRGLEPDALENLHFHFAEPDDCLLGIGRPNGPIVRTPLFDALRAAAITVRPALIVVDSIAATFGGNQNDRVHARTFVGLFRKLAREIDCAVLLLDHPSLSGINSGTGRGGSVDWQNATRGRMYFETVTDDDGGAERVLTVKKTNYAKEGERITLRWQDGCFVPLGTAPPPARAAADALADQTYLDCLDIMTAQGSNVFRGTGKNYAPGVFADMAEAKAKGVNKRGLEAAQDRLLRAGTIWNEPFGPKSRDSRRLARKPAEHREVTE